MMDGNMCYKKEYEKAWQKFLQFVQIVDKFFAKKVKVQNSTNERVLMKHGIKGLTKNIKFLNLVSYLDKSERSKFYISAVLYFIPCTVWIEMYKNLQLQMPESHHPDLLWKLNLESFN